MDTVQCLGADAPVSVAFERKLSDEDVVAMRTMRSETRLGWTALARKFGVHRRHAYRVCVGKSRREAGGPLEPEHTPEPKEPEVRCPECGGMVESLPCKLCDTRGQSPPLRLLMQTGLVSDATIYGRIRERRPCDPTEDTIYRRAAQLRAMRKDQVA